MKIAGGNNDRSGRVVITIDGTSLSICDTKWTTTEANIVCRNLGYQSGTAILGSYFGGGTGRSFIDNVTCSRNSPTILNCMHSEISTNSARCSDHISMTRE